MFFYSLGAPLNHIQGSLVTLEPRNPAIFQVFQEQLPKGLSALIEILNGKRRCDIGARWLDEREISISRDGSTLVFHAALTHVDGPRSLYIVNNGTVDC